MAVELGLPWDAYLTDPITPGDETEAQRDVASDGTELFWTTWPGAKQTYQVTMAVDDGTDPELSGQRSKLKAWRNQLSVNVYNNYKRFWLTEVDLDYSRHVLCGWGDGTTTTFPIPINGLDASSDIGIYVNGALQTSGYSTAYSSQLLTDQLCSSVDEATTGWAAIGSGATITSDRRQSAEGTHSVRVDGSFTGTGAVTASLVQPVAASTEYSATFHCKGTGTVVARIWWQSGAITGAPVDGTPVVLTGDSWQEVTVTGTSEATSDAATVRVYRTTANLVPYWFDMVGFGRGATSRVWLPSKSPGVVVFDSAPTDGAVITSSGYGKRMTPVREDSAKGSWTLDVAGQPTMRLKLTEQFPSR